MIQTIEGRIGGGKTYTAMGWICNHLAKGGVVATNINIQLDSFTDQYGEKRGIREILLIEFDYVLQDGQIIYLSDTEMVAYNTGKKVVELNAIVMFYKLVPRGTPDKPVMVVIDEAHIHFPQDGYRSIPREVLNFLTLSRHACVDVVFISQHIKNMWCQMLRLAQFRWAIRDMRKYGLPVGFFNLPWPWPHFLQMKFDYDGSTVMSRKFEWHRKRLYETYKSPELASSFESMPVAASVEIKKRKLTMKEKMFIFAYGFGCCLLFVFLPACHYSNKNSSDQIVYVTNSVPVAVSSNLPPIPAEFEPIPEPEPVERVTVYHSSPEPRYVITIQTDEGKPVYTRYTEMDYHQGRKVLGVGCDYVILSNTDGSEEHVKFN